LARPAGPALLAAGSAAAPEAVRPSPAIRRPGAAADARPRTHRKRLVGPGPDRARLFRRRRRSRRALLDLPRARREARPLVPARALRLGPAHAIWMTISPAPPPWHCPATP